MPPTFAMPHSYVVTGLPSGAAAEPSWPWAGSTTWPDCSCQKTDHLLGPQAYDGWNAKMSGLL